MHRDRFVHERGLRYESDREEKRYVPVVDLAS